MLSISTNWLQQNKRLIIITAVCIAIAANFWAGSRVPSLNDKASLGGDLVLEDPLGFEAAYPVDPGDPLMERIFFTTVNWVLTNRQGMTFGILIAAAFMTILSLLKRRSFSSHFGNTLLGLFIGMPLGVCVNCAAPIARSLHDSGTRLETTLVTMISSPTLNIIVLTMLFSLMPVYMAVTKVAMTLFFLLVLVPLLSRYIFKDQLVAQNIRFPDSGSYAPGNSNGCEITSVEPSWPGSIQWVLQKYASNLFYIIKLTVPLMLLAGFMGAVAITLFSWQEMASLIEGNQWYMAAIGALVIAVIGLFLPVPIAFDVAIVTALLAAGVPPVYAMILLFTLGIFSVYSFFIIWTGISKKVALVLSGVLLLMGILSGIVVDLYLKWDESRQQELFQEFDLGADNNSVSSFFFGNAWADTTQISPVTSSPITSSSKAFHSGTPAVHVSETVMQESSAPADQLFTRQYGEERGLVTESDMSVSYKFMAPFYRNWPVASADINADGWIDIVFGTDKGVFLYKNIQGEHFERIPVSNAGKRKNAMNVALVDLNNDNMPDLYVTSYRGGNYIIFNDNGKFSSEKPLILPDMGSTFLNATAFGDLDLDGDIDIVAGNWTAGRWTRQPGESSRNAILWNEGDSFRVERLEGFPGETLSILISDINQDSYPDLMVGNDFQMPEFYYLGQPDGKLKLIKRKDQMFPVTTLTTMSIDSGDMDNDLDFEIYTTQASGFTSTNPTKRASMLPLQSINASCDEYSDNDWKKRCLTRIAQHEIIFEARQKRNPRLCLEISDEREKKHCLAYLLLEKSTRFDNNPELCEQLKKDWKNMAYICNLGHQPATRYTKQQAKELLRQILGRNVFYKQTKNGAYNELAEDMNIDISGWSWTAKFADLDNDEWQDIYVVNGQYHSQKRATKVFFKNQQGKGFSNDTREAGLENYLAMSSYTYIDYDNDADLDIIAVSFDGPVWIYTNNTRKNQGIIFELDDRKGNRTGIGSRIIIHYGENGGKHQIREIKASGGFLSFDAPRAHFGLGKYSLVSRVEVIWSTGEKTELSGEFKAGHKYRIERSGA
jgi:uncharacterized membrane protein YraQ (UPF0718 family)